MLRVTYALLKLKRPYFDVMGPYVARETYFDILRYRNDFNLVLKSLHYPIYEEIVKEEGIIVYEN